MCISLVYIVQLCYNAQCKKHKITGTVFVGTEGLLQNYPFFAYVLLK